MKTLFAAVASALLVSTAFAQTAAPSTAQPAQPAQATQMPAAGQANLKANTAVQAGATKDVVTTTKAPAEATKQKHVKKISTHTKKTHKSASKNAVETSAAKSKTDSAKEASKTPAKADGAQTDTTKAQ
ncbi:conserved hypothetical protein [Burkholderia sp. H160]|nr:conserved hypothetical protein [Burkholderia sp. H160]